MLKASYKSADPCRQQGERVREEITSNKCCAVQVRGKRGGDRKGSQVQSKKPQKGSEKGGAVSANVASERSTKQEVRRKNAEARVNERQKVTFGSLGYGPRAQSVFHCHGVLALRGGPLTGASGPWCLSSARGSLDRSRAARKPAVRQRRQVGSWQGRKGREKQALSCKTTQASWQLAMQERTGKARFQLQDDAGKLAVGSAGRQGKARFEASF